MNRVEHLIARYQEWAIGHLPAGMVARPFEWFVAILCGLSGASFATRTSNPQAADAVLPDYAYYLWSATLIAGCLFMVCGLSSIKWEMAPYRYILRRTPCYQFGLRLLGLGSATWAAVLLINSGWNAILSSGLAVIFSGVCIVRLLTVKSQM